MNLKDAKGKEQAPNVSKAGVPTQHIQPQTITLDVPPGFGAHQPIQTQTSQELNQMFSQKGFDNERIAETRFDSMIRRVDKPNSDIRLCSEYIERIMEYLFVLEFKQVPPANYTNSFQQAITPTMVTLVVDWLLEVTIEYKLQTETYFLGIDLMHRFLSIEQCAREKLQLVSVCCLWVAAKYEECVPPPVDDFAYITDDTYSCDEFRAMERTILNALDFNLTVATARTFLKRFCHVASSSIETALLSGYLTEMVQRDVNFLNFKPSLIAASAVALSRLATQNTFWDATLQHYTRYSAADLKECVLAMHASWVETSARQSGAAFTKYSRTRVKRVACLPPVDVAFLSMY